MTNEKDAGTAFLGKAHQARRRFADLTDRTGRGRQQFGPDGLNGIDDEDFRLAVCGFGKNAFDRGFGKRFEAVQSDIKTTSACSDLGETFLAGHIQAAHA